MEKIKLKDLCTRLESKLIEYQYSADSMYRYRRILKELNEIAGEEYYAPKICAEFLVDKIIQADGFVEKGTHSKKQMYYLRTIRILEDMYYFGDIFHRNFFKGAITWPKTYVNQITHYKNYLVNNQISKRHLRRNEIVIFNFVKYISSQNIETFGDIKGNNINGFINIQIGISARTLSVKLSILKNFLKFLYLNGYINNPLSDAFPKIRISSRKTLPKIWSKEDIHRILDEIDTGNPTGKRNYAIILLIARTGLRIGDVRNLKLSDIDWKNHSITLIQKKTSEPLSLPLSEDAGWAIIEYLKNGRPVSEYTNVFLRHLAPFIPFSSNYNIYEMVVRHVRKAGIATDKEACGVHSLRHTLASELLKNHVELKTISEILGHKSIETTRNYLRINTDALSLCALDVEVYDAKY